VPKQGGPWKTTLYGLRRTAGGVEVLAAGSPGRRHDVWGVQCTCQGNYGEMVSKLGLGL